MRLKTLGPSRDHTSELLPEEPPVYGRERDPFAMYLVMMVYLAGLVTTPMLYALWILVRPHH